MVRRCIVLLLAVLLGSCGIVVPAAAQEKDLQSPEGPVLTLEEALRLTLEHSPRVQRAISAVRASRAELAEAESVRRPRIDLAGGLERFENDPTLLPSADRATAAQLSLSYRHVIAEREDTRLTLEAARVQAETVELAQKREGVLALADVVDAYVSVLEAESALALSRLLERNAAEMERVTRERFESGTATEADLLAAQAAAQRARHGVKVAESSLDLAYDALFQLIGLPVPEPRPRLQSTSELVAATAVEEDLDQLLEYALRASPDYLQAQKALAAAQLALEQVRRVDRPRWELTGSYQWVGSGQALSVTFDDNATLGVAVSRRELLGDASYPPLEDTWRLGAQVRWPLVDGGAGSARERRAREQVRQAELRLEELRGLLSLNLARQYDQVVQALQDVGLAEADLLEAQRRYDIVRRQFEEGVATRLELWQAEAAAAQHRTERVRAEARVLRARMQLAVVAGIDQEALLRQVVDLIGR